ncbi:MAG: hypothetical protein AAF434_14950 [Pseudomonadota bacterium]
MARKRTPCKAGNAGLDDETIYLMMLHKYQRVSCRDLARRFGITQGQAYNIIAKRQIGGCCG